MERKELTRKSKLACFRRAVKLMHQAADALQTVQNAGGEFAGDAAHYKAEILELVSCDQGQAGIEACARMLEYEIEFRG